MSMYSIFAFDIFREWPAHREKYIIRFYWQFWIFPPESIYSRSISADTFCTLFRLLFRKQNPSAIWNIRPGHNNSVGKPKTIQYDASFPIFFLSTSYLFSSVSELLKWTSIIMKESFRSIWVTRLINYFLEFPPE